MLFSLHIFAFTLQHLYPCTGSLKWSLFLSFGGVEVSWWRVSERGGLESTEAASISSQPSTLELMWQQLNWRLDFVTLPYYPPPPPHPFQHYLPTSTHPLPPPPAMWLLFTHSVACETGGSLGALRERERRERVRLSQNREAGGGERDDDGSQLWHWGEFWRSLLSHPAATRLCFAGQEASQGGQGD